MRILAPLLLLLLTACPAGFGGPIDWYGYSKKWQYLGEVPPPRCADAVHEAAIETAPCTKGRPLTGYVHWHKEVFNCDGRLVYGCSDPGRPWVAANVTPWGSDGHASTTAMPEEIAHWVWPRCRPGVRTEWEEKDPVTGKTLFKRDPEFMAWYKNVAKLAKERCQ